MSEILVLIDHSEGKPRKVSLQMLFSPENHPPFSKSAM